MFAKSNNRVYIECEISKCSKLKSLRFMEPKKLSLEEMEEIEGGRNWGQCIGGFVGLGALAGFALFAPAATAAVLITGQGALLAAGITALALDNIYQGC
jgi:hypothetical protein